MTRGFSAEDLAAFGRDGFVVIRGLVPQEDCTQMLAAAQRDLVAASPPLEYEADTQYPGAPQSLDAPGGRTVRRLLQACKRDAVFRKAASAPAIAARLRQLLGPQIALAQVHHNCVMTKQPQFSSQTHWHRDIRYWSYERAELVSAWFALGAERPHNGCLMVLPGTQNLEVTPEQLDAAQFLRTDLPVNAALLRTQMAVDLDAGDVLFFHSRLFHAAENNRSTHTKFSAVFTYRALDNQPLPGSRSASVPDIIL